MDSATLIKRVRTEAGLTQRQLGARGHTSAAAVSLYESGQRIPRVDTLARLLAAAGSTLVLDAFPDHQLDDTTSGKILLQVLELSEHLPFRRPGDLQAPVFAELAR